MGRKIKICSEAGCHNAQTTQEYCRLHYMKNWKAIKEKAKQKEAKRLNRYVEGIMRRNPDVARSGERGHSGGSKPFRARATEEVESVIEDLGYSDPDSLDEIISNLRLEN